MKTPEEMAIEHANNSGELEDTYVWRADRDGFLAGYKAAMKSYATKLEEANATIDGLADECEGLKSILYDHDETNLPTSAKWISVKDRLPEIGKEILWYHEPGGEFSVGLLHHKVEQPFFTHWMELPEPPKEEK